MTRPDETTSTPTEPVRRGVLVRCKGNTNPCTTWVNAEQTPSGRCGLCRTSGARKPQRAPVTDLAARRQRNAALDAREAERARRATNLDHKAAA
jgi:hypothetical protein